MIVLILPNVALCTNEWHSEGAVVVCANDLEHARVLIKEAGPQPTEDEMAAAVTYQIEGSIDPKVYVFPNAGCC